MEDRARPPTESTLPWGLQPDSILILWLYCGQKNLPIWGTHARFLTRLHWLQQCNKPDTSVTTLHWASETGDWEVVEQSAKKLWDSVWCTHVPKRHLSRARLYPLVLQRHEFTAVRSSWHCRDIVKDLQLLAKLVDESGYVNRIQSSVLGSTVNSLRKRQMNGIGLPSKHSGF